MKGKILKPYSLFLMLEPESTALGAAKRFIISKARNKVTMVNRITADIFIGRPQAYQTVFVRSEHAPYKYSNFLANRYCKYLSFLKSAFTAVYLQ